MTEPTPTRDLVEWLRRPIGDTNGELMAWVLSAPSDTLASAAGPQHDRITSALAAMAQADGIEPTTTEPRLLHGLSLHDLQEAHVALSDRTVAAVEAMERGAYAEALALLTETASPIPAIT